MEHAINHPLVSVIVLCYNQASYVEETLNSILSQTYKNTQLIIVDDYSTKDASVEVIDKWIADNNVDCVFIKHLENQGICKSLNEAFSHATGNYLQLIAADDIMLPNKIERHVGLLEETSDKYALVFSDAYLIDSKGDLYQNRFLAFQLKYLSLESGNFYHNLLKGNFIPAMSILYRTEVLKANGGWDESLTFEDYDMLLRISKDYDFLFDETPTVKYRFHENNAHARLDFSCAFPILVKHVDVQLADNRCREILRKMYSCKHKKLNEYVGRYVAIKVKMDYNLFCMKYKVPFVFYLLGEGICRGKRILNFYYFSKRNTI